MKIAGGVTVASLETHLVRRSRGHNLLVILGVLLLEVRHLISSVSFLSLMEVSLLVLILG